MAVTFKNMLVRNVMREARGDLTQAGFVTLLSKDYNIETSQGLWSKYESGKVNPPAAIIEICMEIIHKNNFKEDVSLIELITRIKDVLAGPNKADARKAFAIMLDTISQD